MNIADDLKSAYEDGYEKGFADGFEAGQRDVRPERKTGNWIHNSDPMAGEGYWNCSECGLNVYTCTDYCPNCGSEMR